MAGTEPGGKKAVETRGHGSLSQAGKKGAEARHAKSPEEESRIAKKAAETRKERDPDAVSKMGEKGGQASGGHRGSDED